MTEQSILLSDTNGQGILRLTLNNPARRNALSEAMLLQLQKVMKDAAIDPRVRVIVLAANGPVFCAVHDLKELTAARQAEDNGRDYFTKIMALCGAMMQAIVNNPKPVIAEVCGIATAAGCQLVASCDLAYADETSAFSTPGVNIGLFCSTPMVALSRNVSNKHALEMLLTGDMISAPRALEIGLINKTIRTSELTATPMTVAGKIAAKSSKTLAVGKQAFYQQAQLSLSDAYELCANVMVENMLAKDAEEGINAFIEKRTPHWMDE
jgi:enoyl-CoA hydratase/carnithine racemase